MERINYFDNQQMNLNVGDNVVIKKAWFKSFKHHCKNPLDIPLHNHGKIAIIEINHSLKDSIGYENQILLYIELPDNSTVEVFSNDVIKLY